MPEDIFNSNDEHRRLSMKVKKDVFYEMSVNNPTTNSTVIYIIYMALCVICGIISFLILLFGGIANIPLMIVAIISALLCALFYTLAQTARVEYDYTFTNGTLDLAKIMNEKKRKKIVSIDVTQLLEMRPITDNGFQRYFNDKNIKKVNIFLNRGEHLYYMVFVKDNNKIVIVFEPNEQLVEYMKLFNPDNILI